MCYFKSAAKILVIPALPPGPPHPGGVPPPPRKKPPAEAHVSRPSSPVKRSTADPTQWSAVESEEIPRPAELPAQRAGSAAVREISELVGEGGFEPPKSVTTDLQSAPFDRSGIPPYSNRGVGKEGGAGGRTRTPGLLITNQLLYQLSYTSSSNSSVYFSRRISVCQQKFFLFLWFFQRREFI